MKIRISKNGQFVKTFPEPVAKVIQEVAEDYCNPIKSLDYQDVPPGTEFYVGEGRRYIGIFPDGKHYGFEAVHSDTVGALGVSYKIGQRFQMPSGTYLIEVSYWGKYVMSVTYITPKEIENGNS